MLEVHISGQCCLCCSANLDGLPCEDAAQTRTPTADNLALCQHLYKLTDPAQRDGLDHDRDDLVRHARNPAVRAWALTLGTKYGRYKLDRPVHPIYTSKTCEVYFAADVHRGNAPVCLKIVHDPENFEGERRARSVGALSPEHVVEVRRQSIG